MRKTTKLLLSVLAVVAIATLCFAGWEHIPGNTTHPGVTKWINSPSPVTLWGRHGRSGPVYPLKHAQVFASSIRYFDPNATTNFNVVETGFWEYNSSNTVIPHSDITAADCTTNNSDLGEWYDAQWDINGDGTLIPKL